MRRMYAPHDWYWIVGGVQAQVWSSKRFQYVPIDDKEYKAWLAQNNKPSRIINAQELEEVMQNQVLPRLAAKDVMITDEQKNALLKGPTP